MERGLIVEAEAADWYEFDRDVTVQRVEFITDHNHMIGCSPDRLVGDNGLLEIKAPLPQTQVDYWLSGEIHARFRPQLQGQLYITKRSWVDIAGASPDVERSSAPGSVAPAAVGNEPVAARPRRASSCRGKTRAVIASPPP
jgi:hypothetical protein